jgi:chlorite dismutase
MESEVTTLETKRASTGRRFLKYTFFKLDSSWRTLEKHEREHDKEQFSSLVKKFETENLLRSYSLVGIRGDCEFLLWTISSKLEDLQRFIGSLQLSNLGKHLNIPYSYLAMTRASEYLGSHRHEGQEGLGLQEPGKSKYLFVYPFIKKREWYFLPHEERAVMMAQHFRIGHKYPLVKIHTGYSFGLDDQEFVLAFEADDPADFLELVMELRSSGASRYTAVETPIFTCLSMGINDVLNLLG